MCLMLSTTLSLTAPGSSASLVFAAVFVIVWCGAAMVTVNAQLLGGSISFFQSVCILGYCVFPLTISAIVCVMIGYFYNQVLFLPRYLAQDNIFIPISYLMFWYGNVLCAGQVVLKGLIVSVGFIWSTKGKKLPPLLSHDTLYANWSFSALSTPLFLFIYLSIYLSIHLSVSLRSVYGTGH